MRAVSSSIAAALLIAALFASNCLSCPQWIASELGRSAPHACCHKKPGEVPAPASQTADCQSRGIQNFIKGDGGQVPQPQLSAAVIVPAANLTPARPPEVLSDSLAKPPDFLPDFQALHSTFRI